MGNVGSGAWDVMSPLCKTSLVLRVLRLVGWALMGF